MANKFKKGDLVIVISGSDKGKTGVVNKLTSSKAVVGGVNLSTIHKKPTSSSAGQIIKSESLVHLSNLSHVDNGVPSKVRFVVSSDGVKSRVLKKTGKVID